MAKHKRTQSDTYIVAPGLLERTDEPDPYLRMLRDNISEIQRRLPYLRLGASVSGVVAVFAYHRAASVAAQSWEGGAELAIACIATGTTIFFALKHSDLSAVRGALIGRLEDQIHTDEGFRYSSAVTGPEIASVTGLATAVTESPVRPVFDHELPESPA